MATDIERLIVSLEARTKSFENALTRANQTANRQANNIERRFKTMNKNLQTDWAGLGRGLIAAFAGARAVKELATLSDAATRITNQLKVAGLAGEELEAVYQKLAKSARSNGAPLESLVTLYSRAAQAQKELGATSDELTTFVDRTALALRINGRSAEEVKGALLQLSQALGSSRVMAEEFNSVNEGARPILQAVARGIEEAEGSVSKLQAMIKSGQISNKAFFKGFLAGSESLQKQAASTNLTIGMAFENLKTAMIDTAKEFNETTDAGKNFATGIDNLAQRLNDMDISGFLSKIAQAKRELVSFLNQIGNADVFKSLNEFMGTTDAAGLNANPAFEEINEQIADVTNRKEILERSVLNNAARLSTTALERAKTDIEKLNKELAELQQRAKTVPERIKLTIIPGVGLASPLTPTSLDATSSAGTSASASTNVTIVADKTERKAGDTTIRASDYPVENAGKDEKEEKKRKKAAEKEARDRERAAARELSSLDGVIRDYVEDVVKAESGGKADAKNPNSSATGVGQFIESTWLNLFRKYYPEMAQNMSRDAILGLRKDADVSRELIEAYATENAELMRKAGVAVTEAALHLAHFLGPGGAISVLKAAPGTPVSQVLGQDAINANPTILGGNKTVDDVIAYGEKRAGAAGRLADETKRAAEAQKELNQASNEFQSFGHDVLGGFIDDIRNGVSAVDALKNALNRVLDTVIDIALQNFLGSFGAGFGGGAGGLLGGMLIPGILHKGGEAGKDGYGHGRAVPAKTFSHAKRYHTGTNFAGGPALRNGELPAILQRGEKVVPKGAGLRSGGREVIDIRLQDDSGRMAQIADQQIETKSGTIVKTSVAQANKTAPGAVAKHQYAKTGGDYRMR